MAKIKISREIHIGLERKRKIRKIAKRQRGIIKKNSSRKRKIKKRNLKISLGKTII